MITRIATHRDILVVDRWYARQQPPPTRVLRRLAAVASGRVQLPSVTLSKQFSGLASLNQPIVEAPWRSTLSPVVYGSNDAVSKAFDDLMKGKWEEGWFDADGNVNNGYVSSSSSEAPGRHTVADVYVHVAFWSSTWRTNQLMRVISRHLSRCQNIIFYTPKAKTSKDAEKFKNHPLVRWLSSLSEKSRKRKRKSSGGANAVGKTRKREESITDPTQEESSAKK